MLNKILAALLLALVLSLGTVSFLYTNSLKDNGILTERIETLIGDNKRCGDTVIKLRQENRDIVLIYENLQKKTEEIQISFGDLEDKLIRKRCKTTNDKVTTHDSSKESDAVSSDIADTYRVLRSAYCLSNRDSSCDDTGDLSGPLSNQ